MMTMKTGITDTMHRRAEAELAAADAVFVGERRQDLRFHRRPAAGQDEDHVERVERPDRGQHHRDDDDLAKLRQRDVPEAAEHAGAVDGGGLVEVGGDRGQAGEKHHDEERQAVPHHGDADREHRDLRIGQEIDRPVDDVQCQRQVAEHAGGFVVEPFPRQAGDQSGHCPGQEDQRTEEAAEGNALVQQDRRAEADDELGPTAAAVSANELNSARR